MLSAFNPLSFLFGGTTGAGAEGMQAGFGAGEFGLLSGLSNDSAAIGENFQTVADNAVVFSDTMRDVADHSTELRENLEAIVSRTNVVQVELRLTGQDWELFKQFGLMNTRSVRDNGGRVRGLDPRMNPTRD